MIKADSENADTLWFFEKSCSTFRGTVLATFGSKHTLPYPTEWDRIAGFMKAVFIETSEFTERVSEYLTDDLYSGLQQELMADPKKGDVRNHEDTRPKTVV